MSYDAIRWAMQQSVSKSSAKFVLVAMANCVNGDGPDMLCWPSVAHLAEATGQDRKTVMDGMRRLRAEGLIVDTGDRKGATGHVTVYALNSTKSGTITPPRSEPERLQSVGDNGTESGTATSFQTVPNFPSNGTEFPTKQYQISHPTVPKTVPGTNKEPVRNQEGTKRQRAFDAAAIDLPDWLDRRSWTEWCADRSQRGKPITKRAAELQVKALETYRHQGHSPESVIEHCITNGYQGLYAPKRPQTTVAKPKHAAAAAGIFGFSQHQEVIDV